MKIIHAQANKNNWQTKKRDSIKFQSISVWIRRNHSLSLPLRSFSSISKAWSIYWFFLNVCLWTFRHFLTILHKDAMQLSIITFLFNFLVFLLHFDQVIHLSAYAIPPYMFAFPWNEHTILADYVKLTSVFVPYCHWS